MVCLSGDIIGQGTKNIDNLLSVYDQTQIKNTQTYNQTINSFFNKTFHNKRESISCYDLLKLEENVFIIFHKYI